MAAVTETFGDKASFALDVVWTGDSAHASSADRTRGELRVWIDGRCCWGTPDGARGVEWTWIELVEGLATHWPYLRDEDGYPFHLAPTTPLSLWLEAERVLSDAAEPIAERATATLTAFVESHELSSWLQGVHVPPLWFVKSGRLLTVASTRASSTLRAERTFAALAAFADRVLELALAKDGDARAASARDAWAARDSASHEDRAKVFTQLSDDELRKLQGKRQFASAWEIDVGAPFEPTELLAAARATARLVPRDVQLRILDKVRDTPAISSPVREEWTRVAQGALDVATIPWKQGHEAARALRAKFLHETDPVDIEHILRTLQIRAAKLGLGSVDIDALAVWGPRHGPIVLWNPRGRYAGNVEGRRATFAHELAHVLIDREGSLPLLELLGRRTPEVHESRARSFAAELLCPKAVAEARFDDVTLEKAKREFTTLKRHYGVSAELAAWQVYNSNAKLRDDVKGFLRSHVSRPASLF